MKCVSLEPPYTAESLLAERTVINDSPEYQRASGVWSLEKQQLFIDTLLNGYDIPKLYFHDIRNNRDTHYKFAIVDGKQRVHALWKFLMGEMELGYDVNIPQEDKSLVQVKAKTGLKWTELDNYWRRRVNRPLPIVVIQEADEDDIEELFSRLNNGEPLSGAEKRNAISGDMCKLIRDIAEHEFFKEFTSFSITRLQHFETSAKFILMEKTASSESGEIYCILKKRFLDGMTKNNKRMGNAALKRLKKAVIDNLNIMTNIFEKNDPLLKKLSAPQIYYVFCREICSRYGHKLLYKKIHAFLGSFQVLRADNLRVDEDERDGSLLDFDRLMSQNNDKESMRKRAKIMTQFFLKDNLDVERKDKKRLFTHEEKYVIYIKGDKKCAKCEKEISLNEMDADHIKPFAHGGPTTFANARSLCIHCNRSDNAKTS